MVEVSFTSNIQRHVSCPTVNVEGSTVKEVMDNVFAENPKARSYILDEQGAVRTHMIIFVNGSAIDDRETLSDKVSDGAEVYIMQALSGG